MTVGESKYDANPNRLQGQKDIISHILDLTERITTKEKSLQIGHTALEDGDLTVRGGDIKVSETDDTVVLRIKHGSQPKIEFYPLGENDTHKAVLSAFDFGSETVAVQLYSAKVNDDLDGGKVLLFRDAAIISHQPDGGQETYVWLNALGAAFPEVISLRGRWLNKIQFDSNMALYMGDELVLAGVSTWTHTYTTPFATKTIPVVSVGSAGTTFAWGLDAYSTASFTVRFATTVGDKMVTFWNFRSH